MAAAEIEDHSAHVLELLRCTPRKQKAIYRSLPRAERGPYAARSPAVWNDPALLKRRSQKEGPQASPNEKFATIAGKRGISVRLPPNPSDPLSTQHSCRRKTRYLGTRPRYGCPGIDP